MATLNASDIAFQKPQLSKFKLYGTDLIKELKNTKSQSLRNVALPFYWYQIKAVLETKKIVMRDDYEAMTEDRSTGITSPKPILVIAPTGAGKSGIIVLLPYVLESSKVLVLTPSKVISEQLRVDFGPSRKKCFLEKTGYQTNPEKLKNFLEPVTIIKSADEVINPEFLGNLVIVNAQKFGGRSGTSLFHNNKAIVKNVEAFFAHFDTLIVDEAHHYPATTWKKIVSVFKNQKDGETKRIIFLTATPYRTNSKQYEDTTYLCDLIGGKERIALEIMPNMVEGQTTRKCEFKESGEKRTYDQLSTDLDWFLADHHNKENRFLPQGILLVRTQREAIDTATELNKIHGNTQFAVAVLGSECNPNRRGLSLEETPLDKFTAGQYRVAVTCGVALEGYDNSKVTLCVILRKIVTGRVLFTQFIGRCKRMNRDLGGHMGPDRTLAIVFSYKEFEQQKMWDEMDELAQADPVEIEEDQIFHSI